MEKARKGMIGIYAIVNNKTGDRFIGSSASMNNALMIHMIALKTGKHINEFLQQSWIDTGPENFSFIILEMVNDKYSLVMKQVNWLSNPKTYSIDCNTSLLLKQRQLPCARLATSKETINDLRELKLGTIIQTIRILIDFYHQQTR